MTPGRIAPPVMVETVGDILRIQLNRPTKRNALTGEMATLIAAAMDRLDDDPHLLVGIVCGAGPSFCAGMDLKAFASGDSPYLPGRGFAGFVESGPRKPLIAAVQGHAVAGGMEVALACDLVVADQNAVFGLPEVTRGLIASGGGLIKLAQRIPPAVSMELALTGRNMTATEAHRLGLVSRIAPSNEVWETAIDLARDIAKNAPLAVNATKQVLLQARQWRADEQFDRQREIATHVTKSADAAEGARAFTEKRTPAWSGT